MLEVTLRRTTASHPGGSSNTLSCFVLQKPGLTVVSHYARENLPYLQEYCHIKNNDTMLFHTLTLLDLGWGTQGARAN